MRAALRLFLAGLVVPFVVVGCVAVLGISARAYAPPNFGLFGIGTGLMFGFFLPTGVWPRNIALMALIYFPIMAIALFLFYWTVAASMHGVSF